MAGEQYFNLGDIYGRVSELRNNDIRNRLAQMQQVELERKMKQENAINKAYTAGYQPARPAQSQQEAIPQSTGEMPSYTGNALAMNYGNQPVITQPAVSAQPARMDYNAVQQSLASQGQGQMIPDVQKQQQAEITQHLQYVTSLAAINPQAGVQMWNNGPLAAQLGNIQHIGSNKDYQFFQHPHTGAITAVNKLEPLKPDGTPNAIQMTQGEAQKELAGFGPNNEQVFQSKDTGELSTAQGPYTGGPLQSKTEAPNAYRTFVEANKGQSKEWLDKEWARREEEKTKLKWEGLADTRQSQVLDIDLKSPTYGRVIVSTLGKVAKDPTKYVSTQDPNFSAMKKNIDYGRMNKNYVNTIHRYGNVTAEILKKYNLNQDSKLLNYGIQDLIKSRGMGSGDVAALQQVIAGLQQEVAKVESGALGISGAHVETAKIFSKTLNSNMPAKDLLTILDWSRRLGDERLKSIEDTTNELKGNLGMSEAPSPSNRPLPVFK